MVAKRLRSVTRHPPTPIDSVTLTVPNESRFYGVARLLVGGLAARLELAYERMDDLQLAVESILQSQAGTGPTVTVRAELDDERLELWVGPLDGAAVSRRLGGAAETFSLHRILSALVEEAELVEQDGAEWLRLEQHVVRAV